MGVDIGTGKAKFGETSEECGDHTALVLDKFLGEF